MNFKDLRAIVEGYSTDDIETCSSEFLLSEGAISQSIKLQLSDTMKSAKYNMRVAKDAKRSGATNTTIRKYDEAIKDLKKLQKQASDIEDDHIVVVMLETFLKSFTAVLAGVLTTSCIGVVGDIILFIYTVMYGGSKIMDLSIATRRGLTTANKAGKKGSVILRFGGKLVQPDQKC